jgi:hypothetical protein
MLAVGAKACTMVNRPSRSMLAAAYWPHAISERSTRTPSGTGSGAMFVL